MVQQNDSKLVICGDALPTAQTAIDQCPYLIFWDEEDARQSARKILNAAEVLYPGHDRPFRVSGGRVAYVNPPSRIQVTVGLEPGGAPCSVVLAPGENRPPTLEGLAVERKAAARS